MPRRKSKRATSYHQRPNALSALDIYTMMSYQRFQALCAISLVRGHRMLMLSMVLDEDDDDSLLLLYRRHQSILHNNNFLFVLDSLSQKILFLVFFQPTSTIPSTCWTTGGATTTLASALFTFVSSTIG
jgi:hypothetical protein